MLFTLTDWLRHRARLRVWNADRAWGRRGEDLAHRYLRKQGYTVVARNYRTRSGSGEVDIVAWDGAALAFVEVKTRASSEFGSPERAVDAGKQHRLIVAAMDYCRRADIAWEKSRFDVVAIVLGNSPEISLIRDAFPRPLPRSAPRASAANAT